MTEVQVSSEVSHTPSGDAATASLEEVFLFPLAAGQERIWFVAQLAPGQAMFNLNTTLRVRGDVDVMSLRRALAEIARRHEALRTRFRRVDGEPMQVVLPSASLPLAVCDLRDQGPDAEEAARVLLAQAADVAFDLSDDPLVRTTLVRTSGASALLSVTMHHIISDGWSIGLFFSELSTLWAGYANGRPSQLPELEIQYGDYALWVRERLAGPGLAPHVAWWRTALHDAPVLELPADRPRPREQTFAGARVPIEIEPALREALEALGRAHGATPFMTLLAAFVVLLQRSTGEQDIVVGSYVAGRHRPELEPLIGFFLNTLPLRIDASGDPTFAELLLRVRSTTLEVYEHQEVPFARLVEELNPERDPSRSPLCQIIFQIINVPTIHEGDDERSALVEMTQSSSAFDLTCTLWASGAGLRGHFEYSTDLFDQATVERLVDRYRTLLGSIVQDHERPISQLDVMPAAERRLLLETWNTTDRAYPETTLAELFREALERHPEAVAFSCGTEELSYRELERDANRLAHELANRGAGPEAIVGICLERSLAACVALVAIVKTGAAFLPLDPTYPRERLAFMVHDAGVVAVVTDAPLAGRLQLEHDLLVRLDADAEAIAARPATPPAARGDASSLAYVIYTSGSTGTPKGVAVEQRQILNRLAWMWEEYPFAEAEVGCQKTALGFVDSIWELLGYLLRGVPTVVIPDETVRDPAAFVGELARTGVSRLWVVPAFLRAVLDADDDLAARLPALRFWVTSGEPLPAELDQRFRAILPDATLYNLYGTSEVWDATWFDPVARPGSFVRAPIGKPIANVRTYVLDARGEPTPIGVFGELHVGGAGVARGYLPSAGSARARFRPDPFSQAPDALLYASGDVVRYLADGTIEFLGRPDDQVKIRGYRVELGEVEAALARDPTVRETVVAVEQLEQGSPTLVAYVVARDGATLDAAELRARVRARLPEHMVPAAFVPLDDLPLTPSGKRDRLRLPTAAPRLSSGTRYESPVTRAERLVSSIWEQLLGVERVGRRDNFFDIGGHSLLLFQVQSRLAAATGRRIPMTELFRHPTVDALASRCAYELEPGETEHAVSPNGVAAV